MAENDCAELANTKPVLAAATIACTEAKLMSVMLDKGISAKCKKSKIEGTFTSLSKQPKEHGEDPQTLMHPLIVKEATAYVLMDRR